MRLSNDNTGGGITVFFIQWDMYLLFFSPCDIVDALTEDNMSVYNSVLDSPSTDYYRLFYSSPGSDVFSSQESNAINIDSNNTSGIDRPDSPSQYSQPLADFRFHIESPLEDNPFDQLEQETSVVTHAQAVPHHSMQLMLTSLAGP